MQALCGLQGIFDLFNCKTPGTFILYLCPCAGEQKVL